MDVTPAEPTPAGPTPTGPTPAGPTAAGVTAAGLTAEQRQLRDAVRGLLARHGPEPGPDPGAGPGWDRGLWRRLCGEIGAAGLAIPERYGGAGAGLPETCVVMAELGRALTPAPLLGSAVLAAQALLAAGDEAACQRLLPSIAAGTAVAALAWTPASGRWDPGEAACTADPGAGGWALTGDAHYVLDGDVADVLLAAAGTPAGTGLFEVDLAGPGVSRTAVTTMDTSRRLAVVRLAGAAGVLIGQAGGGAGALARARDLACIALSAEQAGAAERALELTVGYTRDRVQFGRPIASFQALQHRMADLHVLVESARSLSGAAASGAAASGATTYSATASAPASAPSGPPASAPSGAPASAPSGAPASAPSGPPASAPSGPPASTPSDAPASTPADAPAQAPAADPDLGLLAAAAKAYCSEALLTVAAEMIQLHGALGITWEHPAHRYFKRAHGAAHLFGPPADHLARIAAALLDAAVLGGTVLDGTVLDGTAAPAGGPIRH